MDMEKVLAEGRSHSDMEATFAFKLPQALKDDFIELCTDRHLSTGRVVRSLLEEFIAAVRRENADA